MNPKQWTCLVLKNQQHVHMYSFEWYSKKLTKNVCIQVDLEKEIESLRSLLDHHPQLAKYAMEVKQLKSALSKLKESPGVVQQVQTDGQTVQGLEEMYKTIMAEQTGVEG